MPNNVIGSLRVNLSAATADFEKGLASAQRELSTFGKNMEKVGKNLKLNLPSLNFSGLITGAGAAAAATAALAATFAGMQRSLAFADELVAAANKLGVATDALQALQFAANETDIANEQLAAGLAGLNAALGAFQSGVGDARVGKVFDRLGLSRADVAQADNAAEFLPVLADRIAQVQTQAERVKLAKALGVEELLPLLEQGSAEINTMTERARRLGLVMDRDLAEGAAEAHRKLEILQGVVGSRLTVAFAELAESIIGPIDNMDVLIGKFDDMEAAARRNLRTVASWFKAAADVVDAQTKLPWGQEIETGLEKWLRDRAAMIDKVAAFGEGTKPSGRRGGSGTPQGPGFRGGYASEARDTGGDDDETKRTRTRTAATREATKSADDYRKALADLYVTLGDDSAQATARLKERLEMLRAGFEAGQYSAAEVARAIRLIDEELERVGFNDRIVEVSQNVNLDPAQALPDWTTYGGKVMPAETAEALRREAADAFRGGLEALRYGGGEGVMQYLADQFSDRLLDALSNQLADLFDALLAQMRGGSGGGILGGLGNVFGGIFGGPTPVPVPKFATGGIGRVGGSGGVDSKRVSIDVTPGELVAVTHGDPFEEFRRGTAAMAASLNALAENVRRGMAATPLRSFAMPDVAALSAPLAPPAINLDSRNMHDGRSVTHIHLEGALVADEVWAKVEAIAAKGDARVIGTVAKARQSERQAQRYRVGRGAA